MENRNTALKIISNWTKDELLQCLNKNNLSYCTDAVQNREIDGEQFLGATEHKIIFWGIPRSKRREVLQFVEDLREFPENYVNSIHAVTTPVQQFRKYPKFLPPPPSKLFTKLNVDTDNADSNSTYRNFENEPQRELKVSENDTNTIKKRSIENLALQLNTILREQFPNTFNKQEPAYENIDIYRKHKNDLWKNETEDNSDHNVDSENFYSDAEADDGVAQYYEFPLPIEEDADKNETNRQINAPVLPPRPSNSQEASGFHKPLYDSFDSSSSEDLSETQTSVVTTPSSNVNIRQSRNPLPPKPTNFVVGQSNLSARNTNTTKYGNTDLPSRRNKPQVHDTSNFLNDDIDFSSPNKNKIAADLELKFKTAPNFNSHLKNNSSLHKLPKPPPIRNKEFQSNAEKVKAVLSRDVPPKPFNRDNEKDDHEEENLYEAEPVLEEQEDYIEPIQHKISITSRPLPPKPSVPSPTPTLPQTMVPTKPLPSRPPVPVPSPSITSWPLPKPPVEQDEWFVNVNRTGAENLLKGRPNGTFIFRPSSKPDYIHTLSLIFEECIYNIPVVKTPNGSITLGISRSNERTFADLKQLVEFHRQEKLVLLKNGVNTGSVCLRSMNM